VSPDVIDLKTKAFQALRNLGFKETEARRALEQVKPTHDYESGGLSSARSSRVSWSVVFSSAWRGPFAAVQRLLFGLLGTALSRAQSRAVFQSTIRADPIGRSWRR